MRGETWPRELLVRLTADECATELFRVVAEGLADRFDPRLCEVYERVFSEAFRICDPELEAGRGARRRPGGLPHNRIYILSRVTLGADVAITSVVLDAAKKRFPDARIFFVGDRKGWELFESDSRLEHLAVSYPRNGSIRERLECWRELRRATSDGIVIDPDSRLTQLGLLPMGDGYFFNSRACGNDESLNTLTRRWTLETFGVEGKAYIAPKPGPRADITVSLGVGGNAAKRIGDLFERELIRALVGSGLSVLVDKGAGGEEAERVERAVAGLPVKLWNGAFAPFADAIAHGKLYVGYDSAGQHVAAACGVPLVSVFAGFPVPRMFSRWRPTGRGPVEVVRVDNPDPAETLERTLLAIRKYGII